MDFLSLPEGIRPDRWLVFTSAGRNSNVRRWLGPGRLFDLWVVYYRDGDIPEELLSADYLSRRKGSKFQNLHAAFEHHESVLARYEAILVIDDDIVISPEALNDLFRFRASHDLWIAHAAFNPIGKVSHPITAVNPATSYRLTNFVEVTAPLFRADKLFEFMGRYDPRLVGWGVDWLFLHELGPDLKGHVAICDEIVCLNPHDRAKTGGRREIDQLQNTDDRRAMWEQVRAERSITIDDDPQVVFSAVPRVLHAKVWSVIKWTVGVLALKVLRKLRLHD
jgi:hypothetical protein